MTCDQCRDAMSAAMDDQSWPERDAEIATHLQDCAACRSWQVDAVQATRVLRLRVAETVPDLSATITAAVLADPDRHASSRWRRTIQRVRPRPEVWRAVLGVLALAQITLGLSEILGVVHGVHVPAGGGEHLFNESSAWNLAVGVGFAGAAIWPRLAAGLLPTLGIFTVILFGMSVADLAGGAVSASRIATHAVLFAGVLVMLVVYRQQPDPQRPAAGADDDILFGAPHHHDTAATRGRRAGTGRRGLRPVGHRAA